MGNKKSKRKRSNRKTPPADPKLGAQKKYNIDFPHLKPFAFITVTYAVSVGVLALLFGTTFATVIATPVWAFLYLIFSKWNRRTRKQGLTNWQDLLKFPRLNYLHVGAIVLTIFLVQFLLGYLIAEFQAHMRPEFYYSVPDNLSEGLLALRDDAQTVVAMVVGAFLAYFAGGFVAGKLPNKKCPAPYRHGIVGAVIWNLFSFSVAMPILMISDDQSLSKEDFGLIILSTIPGYLVSALGTWLAVRRLATRAGVASESALSSQLNEPSKLKSVRLYVARLMKKNAGQPVLYESASIRQESTVSTNGPPQAKSGWFREHGRIVWPVLALLVLIGSVSWMHRRNSASMVSCQNPPPTAMLNIWPVDYSTVARHCHDLPPIDAKLVDAAEYSRSREQWERGLTVQPSDEIYVLIYINNGAADNAELINPGYGIARNVRLTTDISTEDKTIHYIRVEFAGENTNTVVSRFKIASDVPMRLIAVPESGEIRNYIGTELIAKGLDVGNKTLSIGDLAPKWEASVFVRFRARVEVKSRSSSTSLRLGEIHERG